MCVSYLLVKKYLDVASLLIFCLSDHVLQKHIFSQTNTNTNTTIRELLYSRLSFQSDFDPSLRRIKKDTGAKILNAIRKDPVGLRTRSIGVPPDRTHP